MKHIHHHSDGRVIDLTEISTPLGLLDDETQEALKAHGGPFEYFSVSGEWSDPAPRGASFYAHQTYRVKPAPVEETHTGKGYCVNNGSIPSIYSGPVGDSHPGTCTLTTRDGKPVRAVWETDQ